MSDLYDLLNHLCGYDLDVEPDDAESDFYEKYGIAWENAEPLIRDLIPLAMIERGPLTEIVYQGFGSEGLWLAREKFISGGDTAGGEK